MLKNNKYVLVALMAIFISGKSESQLLKVGDKVPEFKLPEQNGKVFDLKNSFGKENLVIYFYPKDESTFCTKEACAFRDNSDAFLKKDAKIIGISSQSVASHKEFADHHKLPFVLLSDQDNNVHKLFGVSTSPMPDRVTFVVDKTGTIVYCYESITQPLRHVELALKALNNSAANAPKK